MKRILGGSRYANVTSTLALVIALGGTGAYAASTVGSRDIINNSIRSGDIRNGEVKGRDIAAGAVTSGKIRNGTLLARDFKPAELRAGPAGPKGDSGARGPSDVRVIGGQTIGVPTCNSLTSVADCPDLLTRRLEAGNWLITAKLMIANNTPAGRTHSFNRCGLVLGPSTTIDEMRHQLGDKPTEAASIQSLALSAVVSGVVNGTNVALRCSAQAGETLTVAYAKLIALKVEAVNRP